MIRKLGILWEHTPDLAEIPVITSDSGKTFCELLREIRPALIDEGIVLKFTTSPITGITGKISRVTINGRLLEEILLEVAKEQRYCEGRRCEMNSPVSFPVVSHGNTEYQSVPELIIRKVLLRAAGII
jgi:hypothetical protein